MRPCVAMEHDTCRNRITHISMGHKCRSWCEIHRVSPNTYLNRIPYSSSLYTSCSNLCEYRYVSAFCELEKMGWKKLSTVQIFIREELYEKIDGNKFYLFNIRYIHGGHP